MKREAGTNRRRVKTTGVTEKLILRFPSAVNTGREKGVYFRQEVNIKL